MLRNEEMHRRLEVFMVTYTCHGALMGLDETVTCSHIHSCLDTVLNVGKY